MIALSDLQLIGIILIASMAGILIGAYLGHSTATQDKESKK